MQYKWNSSKQLVVKCYPALNRAHQTLGKYNCAQEKWGIEGCDLPDVTHQAVTSQE